MPRLTSYFESVTDVPLTTPVDAPEIQLRRIDTQAIVQAYTASFEVGDGFFAFDFEPDPALEYTFVFDGDPNATGQVPAGGRFHTGSFSGVSDSLPYEGSIYIDAANGTAGTTVGVNGTPENPVNTLADAVTLAAATGLRSYRIRQGSITLTSPHREWEFNGGAINLGNQDVGISRFTLASLSGVQGGTQGLIATDCALNDVQDFVGDALRCGLNGTMSFKAGTSSLVDCYSRVPGFSLTQTPVFSLLNTAAAVNLRSYSGGITVENMNDPGAIGSLDVEVGRVILEPTCTAGSIAVRGVGSILDNSNGTVVDTSTLINGVAVASAVWGALTSTLTVLGSAGEAFLRILAHVAGRRRVVRGDPWTEEVYGADNGPLQDTYELKDSSGTDITDTPPNNPLDNPTVFIAERDEP